ncbi:zinc-dependent peptidase [Yoonia sp. F2084L]|uniref:M90 family metallopeptidase n=1 Tax=Yoonia sp. F2084L TaxID=2926419 RepID=UPI001FF636AA|nr:M90 family metallopeptidase [Yoonia sp. F2084L]MCK0094189.1 zinc-dependent peptidase [Yoonia sp. F2084L]
MTVILLILAAVVAGFGFRAWQRRARRQVLLHAALSDHQRQIVAQEVPITRRLPDALRARFEGKINLFLDQLDFIGCDELTVTDAMRLSIAAQACLVIVNSDAWYKNLRTILIYPGAFKSRTTTHDGYVVREEEVVRLGESWSRGPVILSWHHSQQGAAVEDDGKNVVLHEFAHQLDDLSGQTNGVPLFRKGQSFAEWERVFLDAFARHEQSVETGKRALLDPYGATNHQEFFAVAIEAFFEKPGALKRDEPKIYGQLAILLDLDPATWD